MVDLNREKCFLVDMNAGKIIEDEEVKNEVTKKHPYRKWLNENLITIGRCPLYRKQMPSRTYTL